MEDDATLLRQYATNRSEAAFAELVRRHVDLVYSAALRQVAGDTHLAMDIAQSVFTDLANKAAAVANCPVLAGWLHTSTHYAAAKAVRSEQRRRLREQQAHAMQELINNSARDAEWSRLRPVLDTAIRQLPPEDRDAILLRFFEGRAFAVIGERLRLTENAARMRVERSLEKLRHELARRGISSTSGALATVLISQAVTAAPIPLASTITAAALTGTAATGAVATVLQFMAITKTQMVVVGAILVAGGSVVISQQQTQRDLEREVLRLQVAMVENESLRESNARLAQVLAAEKSLQSNAVALEPLRAEVRALRDRAAAAAVAVTPPSSVGNAPPSADELKTMDRAPVVKHRVAPAYPFALREAGISGEAIVSMLVDSTGEVKSAHVVRSTHPGFEQPALEAVQQWKFDSGQKRGRAVNTVMEVPIVFTLSLEEPDWF
jgi:RNA polymerase sigma factor (sigma-70 family)